MVHYLLSWAAPADRLFDIAIRFTAPADTPRLLLPAWRPGRYLIQNYAANVRDWSAGERRIWKDGKTSWRVEARADEEVTVSYRFYAGILDAGSSFLDDDEAYVNGTNLFMLVEGLRDREHHLTLAVPAGWHVESQLKRDGVEDGGDNREDVTLRARDYDHLIDSPVIAAASLTRHSFVESDATIHLVFRGDVGIDTEQFIEPVRAIVRSQAQMFGGLPFLDYRFLYHVRDKWHGVEHEDSCSIVLRRDALLGTAPGDPGHDRCLSITAHEFFHVWNVKRIVPAAFLPYDYWQETPTRLLWVMEGMTSYYGDLTLVRGGLWTEQRYIEHLRSEIEILEALPGRHHLPVAQASFDAWLADSSQRHDAGNAWISFYNKGEIVSALLDLTIRQRTDGKRSLDDVVLLLWDEYGKTGVGLEEDGFERAVARVADVGDFFRRYVDGTEPLPYEETLSLAGISFAVSPRDPETASLGVRLRSGSGSTVESVVRGGAGMEAGLLPGDVPLALAGTALESETSVDAALRALPIGETAELVISRAGVVRTLRLTGRTDPRPRITLTAGEPNDLRRDWLRRIE